MNRLTFERRNRRLSQRALARLARVNQSEISQLENGRLVPRPEQRQRIADALNLDADSLLREIVLVGSSRGEGPR